MAWITFESIEFNPKCVSKKGTTFAGYVMKGVKRGFDGAADEPYSKFFFDNSATTVIEKGIERPNVSIVQFLQKACASGDTLVFKNVRRGGKWELESVENRTLTNTASDYEPLTDEELLIMRNKMPVMDVPNDPTRPATPQMGRVNHVMAS